MTQLRPTVLLACLVGALAAGCSSSDGSSSNPNIEILRVANGFGEILPHKVFRLGPDGEPTDELLSIRTEAELLQNVTSSNYVQPSPNFVAQAVVPGGSPGNHFIYAQFTQPVGIDSVMTGLPSQTDNNSLTGAVVVTALNVSTGESRCVYGTSTVTRDP